MKTRFESLDMAKFSPFKLANTNKIIGGKCDVPDGGCSCDTEGGTKYGADGKALFNYSSDTNIYNCNGVNTSTDFARS